MTLVDPVVRQEKETSKFVGVCVIRLGASPVFSKELQFNRVSKINKISRAGSMLKEYLCLS